MADKRQVKKTLHWLEHVRTWQLVILLVLSLVVTATFLRLNNIGMIERRTAVLSADKEGQSDITQARLFDLQRYGAVHMNADSGPVYLEEQYKRDVAEAVRSSTSSSGDSNSNLVKADRTCRAQFPGYSQAYVQCVRAEQAKLAPGTVSSQVIELPKSSLYRHEFSSPLWSPDFAGFSALFSVFLTLVIILRLISIGILRLLLRRHYQHV